MLQFGLMLALGFASLARSAAQQQASPTTQPDPLSVQATPQTKDEAGQNAIGRAKELLGAGQPQEAEDVLRAALRGNGELEEVQRMLAYVLFRENKPRESLEAYTAAARLRTPGPADLKIVASDYVLLNDLPDADKWFTKATAMAPNDADAWYLLGRTKYNENRFEDAVQAFQASLRLRPGDVRSEDNLGLAYEGLNRNGEAAGAFRTAISWQSTSPVKSAQPYLNLGILLMETGDPGSALPNLEEAARLAPENPKVREQLGGVYQQAGRYDDARVQLERAVALAPDIPALHFQLAMVYRKLNLQDRARSEFARAAALNGTQSGREVPNPAAH